MRSSSHTLIFPQINAIKQTRVISFPPFALSISKSKMSIIRHPGFFALFVTAESRLPPPPGVFVVNVTP